MSPRCSSWIAAFVLVLAAPAARASSADAETAFREGRKAMQAGDYATACARFAESERLEPAPGTLLNLADCEAHSGQLVSAHEHFGLAASGFPRSDVRRAIAVQREAELDKRIVRLTLRLTASAPAGTAVHEGDVPVAASALGVARLVDPGQHVITVTAPGHADRPYTLTLHEGDQVDQTLDAGEATTTAEILPPPSAPAAPSEPSPPPPRAEGHLRRTLGIAIGGVGVASLAAGAVTGILALDRASTVKSHCPDLACDSQGLEAASQGKWLAPTSTVTFIAGGVLVAGGAYLVFFGGSASSGVALVPTIAPGAGGAVLRAAF